MIGLRDDGNGNTERGMKGRKGLVREDGSKRRKKSTESSEKRRRKGVKGGKNEDTEARIKEHCAA